MAPARLSETWRIDFGETVVIRARPAYMSYPAYLRRLNLLLAVIQRETRCGEAFFLAPPLTRLEAATAHWLVSIQQRHEPRAERIA